MGGGQHQFFWKKGHAHNVGDHIFVKKIWSNSTFSLTVSLKELWAINVHHRKKVHIFRIKLWFKEIVSLSTKGSVDKRRYFALLFIFVLSTGKPLILGDLNFHVDEPHKDLEAARLLELLNVHNLKQHVTVLTHRSKHTLDSVIYRSNRSFNIPPRAYPGHLTPLPSRGGGNLIISLPGGGEFDPHALGVGNLNCTLDFM